MADTPADVRRDIELTRSRISDTLQELEHKMNVTQIVKDNPWPALALAMGAGVLLSGSKADVKAAAATAMATKGASSRVSGVLDALVAQVVGGFQGAIEARIEGLANDVKKAIGAPPRARGNGAARGASSFGAGTTADVTAGIARAD
jgi:Protein of unknown function (DUF3618)